VPILGAFFILQTQFELAAYPQGYAYPRLRTADIRYLNSKNGEADYFISFQIDISSYINHNSTIDLESVVEGSIKNVTGQ
jgi:hypothetical protein